MWTLVLLGVLAQTPEPGRVLDLLESKARSVVTLHAEFQLDTLPQYRSVVIDFDSPRRRLSWILDPGPGKPVDHYVIDRYRRTTWRDGEKGTTTDFRPYWGGFDEGWNSILLSLVPDPKQTPDGSTPPWVFGLGINLEGKPSREGRGKLQFYGTFYKVPFRWLGLLREEEHLDIRTEGDRVIVQIPSRHKTIILDRETGVLQAIRTVDYDGTERGITCRSVVLNQPLEPLPTPPDCRELPVTRQELEEILESRRQLFMDLLGAVLHQWDRVVESHREGAVRQAYTQELSSLTATWWEARLHQIAAAGIQRRLDAGASWQTLKHQGEKDLEAFQTAVQEQSEVDRVLLKASLEDFAKSLETLFRQKAPAGSDPDAFRTLLRSSVPFDEIWNRQVQPSAKRTTDVYWEELDRARKI